MSYDQLSKIDQFDFRDKKILIIGAGWMAERYCAALEAFRIRNVTILSRKKESATAICERHGYIPAWGGYEMTLNSLGIFDLVIVSTPIHVLKEAATAACNAGNNNVLVEKPGSLYSSEFAKWIQEQKNEHCRVRIAFNRHVYPSLSKLMELVALEGGITSCFYTFTEWTHTIDFKNNKSDTYERWGIANSLHVIAMAHRLIGLPIELYAYRAGSLPWHPSGSRFSGSGLAANHTLFSYHADWTSAGRWGIEVMTPMNAYRLIPLEKLFRCPKGTVAWEAVELTPAFPQVKEGVAEEIAIILNPSLESEHPLVTLNDALSLTQLAEKILGYKSTAGFLPSQGSGL